MFVFAQIKEVINKKLYEAVMKNYNAFVQGMQHIHDVKMGALACLAHFSCMFYFNASNVARAVLSCCSRMFATRHFSTLLLCLRCETRNADLHWTGLHCRTGRKQLGAASDDLTKSIFRILARHRKKTRLLVAYKKLQEVKLLLIQEKKVRGLLDVGASSLLVRSARADALTVDSQAISKMQCSCIATACAWRQVAAPFVTTMMFETNACVRRLAKLPVLRRNPVPLPSALLSGPMRALLTVAF